MSGVSRSPHPEASTHQPPRSRAVGDHPKENHRMLSRTILLTATALASATAVVGARVDARRRLPPTRCTSTSSSRRTTAARTWPSSTPRRRRASRSSSSRRNHGGEPAVGDHQPAVDAGRPGSHRDRQIKNRLSGLCLDVANNSLACGCGRSCRTRATSATRRSAGSCRSWRRSSARTVASATTSTRTRAWPWTLPAGPTANNAAVIQFPQPRRHRPTSCSSRSSPGRTAPTSTAVREGVARSGGALVRALSGARPTP